ncbi:MAG: hypothetical protein HY559_00610 [Gammaproteobacteria bacterium]|nr:hypothetical protein [Gammaproteobacteria bacterium]
MDSSVLLRFVLNEKNQLSEFRRISYAVSSELIRVETLRTMDRYRLRGHLDAIHLSTCLLYQERANKKLVLCTHDEALRKAGLAMGLAVLG